jgi:hypothetical protein
MGLFSRACTQGCTTSSAAHSTVAQSCSAFGQAHESVFAVLAGVHSGCVDNLAAMASLVWLGFPVIGT